MINSYLVKGICNKKCNLVFLHRGCCTGAGTFFFHTVHSKAIYNRVHWIAEQYTQQVRICIQWSIYYGLIREVLVLRVTHV